MGVETLANCLLLVGVSGGIAAYKAVHVVSRLRQHGAQVRVIMTPGAAQFVQPLTFASVSGHPVLTNLFEPALDGTVPHVELARKAGGLVVVPATANIIGQLAQGLASDPLSTTAMSLPSSCPVWLAPAMETHMWQQPAVQHNLQLLRERGAMVLGPDSGFLASGAEGQGRLIDPQAIIEAVQARLSHDQDWQGRRLLVTAGPTREPLDPVRFLSNRSTGRMGLAIARAGLWRGAEVTVIHGPLASEEPWFQASWWNGRLCKRAVQTAAEMKQAVEAQFEAADVLVGAAAVSDFRPRQVSEHKLKKSDGMEYLELARNEDILAACGQRKRHQLLVGFAAEDSPNLEEARRKLESKNLDLCVLNDISRSDSGFATTTNKAWLVNRQGAQELPLMSKQELANRILDLVPAPE